MIVYLDTSVLVSAFTNEPFSEMVLGWLGSRPGELATSDWGVSEFSSALALKIRMGKLEAVQRDRILSTFRGQLDRSIAVMAVERRHFRQAARFCDREELALRGADALHVAVAMESGAILCTLDRKMSIAGAALGADTRFLLEG